MGTWGSGNFDSDTAADHLSDIVGRLLDETTKAMNGDPVELEPDEYWGVAVPCNVELMALLAEQRWVGARVPDLATVRAWKQTYLAIWDASIDDLGPAPAWKRARRKVLVATFDRLAKASKRQEPSTPVTPKKMAAPKKATSRGAGAAAGKKKPAKTRP